MNSNSIERLYRKIERAYPDEMLVFGDGKIGAPLLLIGEAPGKDEVARRKPFVGKAGKNLDGFLKEAGLTRSGLYVTNVCKFRPTKVSAKGTVSNRPPTKDEILFAQPFLQEEITQLAPKVIITLGNTPLRAVMDFSANIGEHHGRPQNVEIQGKSYHLFALYHPASIIYNPSLKKVYAMDLCAFSGWLKQIVQ